MAEPRPIPEDQVLPDRRRGLGAAFGMGIDEPRGTTSGGRLEALTRTSAMNPRGYREVFANREIPLQDKVGYVAGRVAQDVLTDGTRGVYWQGNHPLGLTSLVSEEVSRAAGLAPDLDVERQVLEGRGEVASQEAIDAEFARRMGFRHNGEGHGPPLTLARYAIPALATAVMTQTSGNTNYLNILGGGRTPGFQAVMPMPDDPKESESPLLELGARYLFGRTGRVLPWEEFTQERPDVSYDDYKAYAAYQFDKGPLDLGLFRATSRNLDGEPEMAMLGFRVPLTAAAATAGSLAGGYLGAQHADKVINDAMAERLKLDPRGPRRLAGAAIGSLLGAIGGNVTGSLVNDVVIQPTLNPERLAAAERWQTLTPEQKIAIAKGKGGNQQDQGRQLALTQV